MADQTIGTLETVSIGDLDTIADVYDDTLIPVEHSGNARKMTGAQWKAFAVAAAQNVNKGDDGLTPYIGNNGNWYIGTTDTGVAAAGKDGEDGEDGKDGNNGKDGTDGVTPHIGENGHWYVGTADTGVSAQGPSGSGTGDMLASVYDPDGHSEDIFAYVDNAAKVFWATNGTTLPSEMYAKVSAGYVVLCKYGVYVYQLISCNMSTAVLACVTSDSHRVYTVTTKTSSTSGTTTTTASWSLTIHYIQLTSNKTTAISSSSTDTQYPSAKAVYDYVNSAVESAINDALEASY